MIPTPTKIGEESRYGLIGVILRIQLTTVATDPANKQIWMNKDYSKWRMIEITVLVRAESKISSIVPLQKRPA